MDNLETLPGSPLPLGATVKNTGVQFSLFSRHAAGVTLVLFENGSPGSPCTEIELDPVSNRTGDIWHLFVRGITVGQHYGYRVEGPYDPEKGHRFNRNKLLLDPYTRAISQETWDLSRSRGYDPDSPEADLSFSAEDSAPYVPRSIVAGSRLKSDHKPLNTPPGDSVIYELHLKGFTRHPSSGVEKAGTFAGLTEKIPYLKELGVTAVELMPVQEFDEEENINVNPITGDKLTNFWGYSTLAFFAAKGRYAANAMDGAQVQEFKDMVNVFHRAGIEVILDVVFNHTAEGDENGPTVSFRGIDNSIYYILKEDRRFYKNFSGCGNTVNCNHPLVRDFILDALRYWVIDMQVDGFRFDLASILGRDTDGTILSNPPLIERIEEDPILRNTKIIAEAWDAAGAYQVGAFPGRWADWNGKFRDDVRRFWRGDENTVGYFATRLTGSSDLYQRADSSPLRSINFVTCHDGFTLNDLVSYKRKHNMENGEKNRDGENYNLSHNYGKEGPAEGEIEEVRKRQIKNFIATLFLSQGVPMLLAGDEFRRTQRGNNNSYCQDNEISWVDWSLLDKNRGIYEFTKGMIAFRKAHPILRKAAFFTGKQAEGYSCPDISWHGTELEKPDWSVTSQSIAMLINGLYGLEEFGRADADIYVIFNASEEGGHYQLPDAPNGSPWRLVADTAKEHPGDVFAPGEGPVIEEKGYYVEPRATVVLEAPVAE